MNKHWTLIAGLLLSSAAFAAGPGTSDGTMDAGAAFNRLKSLTGEWEADTGQGKAHLSYELIAGGSALVERESAENMPAMMTVYHLDGSRVVLEHYCMTGNQPRMEASSFNPATGELRFQFLNATNLPDANAPHMHNATFVFGDASHFTTTWELYADGHLKNTEKSAFTRVR